MHHRLACWVKILVDDIFKYFFLILFRKQDLGISCKLSPGDNLHEMSKAYFLGKGKKYIISLSSAEFAHLFAEFALLTSYRRQYILTFTTF